MAEKSGVQGLKHPPKLIPSTGTSSSIDKASINPPPHLQPRQFPSHVDAPDISPIAKIFCEILVRAPPNELETALASTGITSTPALVEEVLKFAYNYPSSAVKFFRWAGLAHEHSPYSWNLMVDLLGKNQLFEQMWNAMRSMKKEGTLSMAAFAAVFDSYCFAGRINEAIMTFDVMDRYGVQQDVFAVNSLMSAICRENQTAKAQEFYSKIKAKISPDGDTFAILFEGWEKEGNINKCKTTFGEMVICVGWSPQNMSAYDAFLNTLVRGSQIDEAINFLLVMKRNNCFPGSKFFYNALDVLILKNDAKNAVQLWDVMVGSGLLPDLAMYNAVIGLLCKSNEINHAFNLLDQMVFNGAFPDSLTYNMIFHCLIKNKKVREAAKFFHEMTKNEWPPSDSNCYAAISMFFECDDPEAGTEIWNYMVDNGFSHLDACANALLVGLSNLERFSEIRSSAEDILERRINIYEFTMEKLKDTLFKNGQNGREAYDRLVRRWEGFMNFSMCNGCKFHFRTLFWNFGFDFSEYALEV